MSRVYIPWTTARVTLLFVLLGATYQSPFETALAGANKRQKAIIEIRKSYSHDKTPDKYYPSDINAEKNLDFEDEDRQDVNDVDFLKPEPDDYPRNDLAGYRKTYDGYYQQKQAPSTGNLDNPKNRFSSSFRERTENDKAKKKEEAVEMLYNQNGEDYEENDQYPDFSQVYNKYQDEPEAKIIYSSGDVKKRLYPSEYYVNLGYDSVGLKKRSRYIQPDDSTDTVYLTYSPRDEDFEEIQEDQDVPNFSSDYYKIKANQRWAGGKTRSQPYTLTYPEKPRYFITKRSSPSLHHFQGKSHQLKRSSNRAANLPPTDPKVARDLSVVFGTIKTAPDDKPKQLTNKKTEKPIKPKRTEHDPDANKITNRSISHKSRDKNKDNVINKEFVPNSSDDKSLQVSKKSIDWSDYFGYDRRKKYQNDPDVDNEWLMERYHQAIAMTSKKRDNMDYPMQVFRSNDIIPSTKLMEKKADVRSEEDKIEAIDTKLKNMEDSIVDEALKYTGAHEGAEDSKEVQDVKDKVIARLAAAYSLEKMRQAIGQYKQSIAKQRKQLELSGRYDEDDLSEDKRASVARKQAVDEERINTPEGDNNIKCSHGDDECKEETYRAPLDMIHEAQWKGECPDVQRVCNEVAIVLGNFGHVLEPACKMHQLCLLCGSNSWFTPTRQCNALFTNKSDQLCEGDLTCQKVARHTIRYLLDVNRSLRSEQSDDCDLLCPDKRR